MASLRSQLWDGAKHAWASLGHDLGFKVYGKEGAHVGKEASQKFRKLEWEGQAFMVSLSSDADANYSEKGL